MVIRAAMVMWAARVILDHMDTLEVEAPAITDPLDMWAAVVILDMPDQPAQ
jgi:hypothetical protein